MPKIKSQFCKNGHDTLASGRTSYGECTPCNRDRTLKYYHLNKEKLNLKKRIWAQKNQENLTKNAQLWRTANPQKAKEHGWKQYGIKNTDGSPFLHTDFDRLYQIQQGRCALCFKHQSELPKSLSVDHDHATGVVRGLLCTRCNVKLGIVEDQEFSAKAGNYLMSKRVIFLNRSIDTFTEEEQ